MASYSGIYTDGKTGRRRTVTVYAMAEGLEIVEDRQPIARWAYGTIRLLEEVYTNQPVRLRSLAAGDARLSVTDHNFLEELRTRSANLSGRDMRRSRVLPRAVGWTFGLAVVLVGMYFGLPLMARPVAFMVPVSWEEKWGESIMRQALTIFGGGKRCANAEGEAALNNLILRIGKTRAHQYRFRVQVVDHSMVNAFAAPGGYIVVFRGLIDKSGSPEELAGVIGHEMGHVLERHGTQALIRQVGMSAIISAMIGDASSIGTSLADFAGTLASLSYGRQAEHEADEVGVAMLNKAGINARPFAEFFERIGKDEPNSDLLKYLSTHPASRDRAKFVRDQSASTGKAMSDQEWRDLKNICRTSR
ncbi:MAG: M48 family metallopeptidase [Alphaproteobacteria bacterium]